jgi:hypothetical protein
MAREGSIADALEEIQRLPTVAGPAMRIRMLGGNREGEE